MNELFWFAYVGFFLLPFCAVSVLIYLEERNQKANPSVLLEVVVAHTVPAEDKQPVASAPTLAELEATANKNERPPPPAYVPPAQNTPLYPNPYAASAAKMQTPRIYIHAVGLR